MFKHRFIRREVCFGIVMSSTIIFGTTVSAVGVQLSATTTSSGVIAVVNLQPKTDASDDPIPTPVVHDEWHNADTTHHTVPTLGTDNEQHNSEDTPNHSIVPSAEHGAPAQETANHQAETTPQSLSATTQLTHGPSQTPISAGENHTHGSSNEHSAISETPSHHEDSSTQPHNDAHTQNDSHAATDSHTEDAEGGHSGSHGTAVAPPNTTTKAIILGMFSTLNLSVLIIAAVFKRRLPKRSARPSK